MLNRRVAVVVLLALAAPLGGCATVSVYQPETTSAEIALTAPQSDLYKASDAFCDQARKKGWASGEASLGGLSAMLTGDGDGKSAYWRQIGADKNNPSTVLVRVRSDATEAAKGLTQLNLLAQKLMVSTKPTKTDVAEFEKALIHARQARDSFSDAIVEFNKRVDHEVQPGIELDAFDKALSSARATADDLAAARTSGSVALLMDRRAL